MWSGMGDVLGRGEGALQGLMMVNLTKLTARFQAAGIAALRFPLPDFQGHGGLN